MYRENKSVYPDSDDTFGWLEKIHIDFYWFELRSFNSALLLYIWKNKRLADTSPGNEFYTLTHDL